MELIPIFEQLGSDALQTVIILFIVWKKLDKSEATSESNSEKLAQILEHIRKDQPND